MRIFSSVIKILNTTTNKFPNRHHKLIDSFIQSNNFITQFHSNRQYSSMTSTISSSPVTIGTHDGAFHCDEALACFMLQQTSQYSNSTIIRTRDEKLLSSLPIIVDVGAIYDPSQNRYDHHQRGFNETLSSQYTMKLSSAGLIYKHFGREVITNIIHPMTLNTEELDVVFYHVYQLFIESLDGIDNGINQYDTDLKPKYKISTDLSSRVGHLNPQWNQQATKEEIYSQFLLAVKMTGSELIDAIKFTVSSWLPARQIVYNTIQERFSIHPSGQIIVFRDQRPIWKSHLHEIEKELGISEDDNKKILYVLFADVGANKWRIQCVPEIDKEFESRKGLPEPWRGIRDQALSTLTGIDGCVFVHASGFIGGNDTYEGVLKMAVQSWEWPADSNKRMKIDSENK